MNVGFIGAGNMGGALARAISANLEIKVYIYDKIEEKSANLAREINAEHCALDTLLSLSDFIFLGVKPNVIAEVCQDIGGKVKPSAVLISMAAGVKISKIEEALGSELSVIRIMPNTPTAVREGLTAYSKGSRVTESDEKAFLEIMAYTGTAVCLDEKDIDSFCAVAGCGPAYAYMFIDALASGAQECGIPKDKAIYSAAKMIRGAALMVLNSEDDPTVLAKNVCSPGGATIEGVKVLDSAGFGKNVKDAIKAAYKRTLELGK